MGRLVIALLLCAGLAASDDPVLLRGCVRSAADSSPVEGATVTVRDWYDVVGERGVDAEAHKAAFVLASGADGTFTVPASRLEGPVITVAAKGHASVTWREDEAAGAEARRDIVLPVAGAIDGRVVGGSGEGVHVYAVEWDALDLEENPDALAAAADLLWGSGQYDEGIAYRFVTATPDGDGRFHIPDADAAKRYAIVAASKDFGPSMLPKPVSPGAPLDDLRLDAAATVRVRIVDEKGKSIVPMAVELHGSPRQAEWVDGENGVYLLEPVGPGFHVLDLKTFGRGELRHSFTLPKGAHDFETTVIVPEGGTVTGSVLDTEGRPIVGARVYVSVWDREAGKSCDSDLHADAEGHFLARGQPAGPVTLYVSAPGFHNADFKLEQPVRGFVVKLRHGRDVTLKITPPKGAPQRDRLAVAIRSLEDGGGPWAIDRFVTWRESKVTIKGVPLGHAAIRIWTPGSALFEREVVLEAGEGPAALEPAPLEPARTVTVRLVDEEGFPVPGLKVHAEFGELPPVDWGEIQRTTGADGRAVLDIHVKDRATIYVEEGQGRVRERRRILIPADGKTVDIPAGPRK